MQHRVNVVQATGEHVATYLFTAAVLAILAPKLEPVG